jgi:uncharacterized protein YprB with RNaseH-like and TPR domain
MPKCEVAQAPPLATELAGEAIATHAGEHWFIRQSVSTLWPAADSHFSKWHVARSNAIDAPLPKRMAKRPRRYATELRSLADLFPRGTLFLDLETCGLAGSMLFLVGLLRYDGESLVLEQLLARNYAEEQAVLQTLWQTAAGCSLLVTFNGKSFDWPLVHDRSTYHRIGRQADDSNVDRRETASLPLGPTDTRPELQHVDLLHHARRRWRDRLPDCRLQTLERFLCGRHRSGDIPGREIPDAYHRYVATGRLDEMQAILHHNALDLVTLLQLAMLMTRGENAEQSPMRIATEEAA